MSSTSFTLSGFEFKESGGRMMITIIIYYYRVKSFYLDL